MDAVKVATEAATALQDAAKIRTDRDNAAAAIKDATAKLEPIKKQFADAEIAAKKSETAKTVADTELELAKAEEKKNAATVAENKAAVDVAEAARCQPDRYPA